MTEQGIYKFKLPPYAHQLATWEASRDAEHWAYLLEMGTGKSKILLDVAAWLYDHGKIDALLVFAPKGAYMSWVDEHVPTHLPDHVPRYVAWWDAGGGAAHERTYETLWRFKGLRVFVVNIEALAYDRGCKIATRFAQAHRCLGVIDESTTIGNPRALRTKAALRLAPLLRYRRILTGSPIANGPLKLYTQAQFLKPWLLGHGSWYSYRNEFCVLKDMTLNQGARLVQFKTVVGYKNIDRLRAKLGGWSTIITKAECLDLPAKVYETAMVELPEEQRRVYEDLRERCVAELSDGSVVTASIVLTKILRLQQVLCGYVPNEDGALVRVAERRVERLLEVVEETAGKVIVWSRFVPAIRDVCEALRKEHGRDSVVEYHGAVSTDDRRKAIERFQQGDARFFVGNQQTGGYGITLTAASTVIYYANSFDLEQRLQSEDRCHRVGLAHSVTYVDLLTSKTVDEKIAKALRDKRKLSDELMQPGAWRGLFTKET